MANLIATVATVPLSTEVSPYLVGGGVLVILFLLVLAVLAFGAGREHS
jgi:hypothetical protein